MKSFRFLPVSAALVGILLALAGGVRAAVNIVSPPQNLAATVGDRAVFTVAATGNGTLTYQWKKGGAPINAATSPVLILDPVAFTDAGSYSVDVSDADPSTTTSSAAGLSVNSAKEGDVDFGFAKWSTINGTVAAVAVQSDGKVLVGGDFTSVNGAARNRIARLNSDGSTDYTFGQGLTGATNRVSAIAVQSDGKVIIGGTFGNINGTARNSVARLNRDGTTDTGFGPGQYVTNGYVYAVALQGDGKVVIGGSFSAVNGTAYGKIARLNSDGTTDTSFGTGLSGVSGTVLALAVQGDGKVIVGGGILAVNGTTCGNFARLNGDGTLDTGFGNGMAGADANVYAIAVQGDGKVLVAGAFATINGTARGEIARLASDGTLDPGFGNGLSGINNSIGVISAMALQSDGRVLVAGAFSIVNGTTQNSPARLNADGTLDTGFGNGLAGTASNVVAMAVQGDGKVIIGGVFTSVNGAACNRVARIAGDGTVDGSFSSGTLGADWQVRAMAVQSDGKVVIGGDFTFINGTVRNHIARLNSDGSLDGSFGNGLSGTSHYVTAVALQSDGKVIIGGAFAAVNGTNRNHLARLNTDGTVDTGYTNTPFFGPSGIVYAIAVQSDGKVLIGGQFNQVNGTPRGNIARLNTNGTLDTGFGSGLAGPDAQVSAVAVQSDGKILIGGTFGTVNGPVRIRVARLNTDGTLDTNFNTSFGANSTVQSIAVQSDGKALIGGLFTAVSNVTHNHIARLTSTGTLDSTFAGSFTADGGVNAIVLQSDGRLFVGGQSVPGGIKRLNSDGTVDTTYATGLTGANGAVNALVVQGDGKVIIGGAFGTVNGTARSFLTRLQNPKSNADLSNLTLSSGTLAPAFVGGTANYTANVSNATASFTITPTSADATATIMLNGQQAASGKASWAIPLNVGANANTIVVTAQDGVTTRTYAVTVTRLSNNADLSLLTVSRGTLNPAFDGKKTAYTASVPNSVASVTVTPKVADSTATVTVNGTAVTSGSASGLIGLNVGANAITIAVTAQDGTVKTYVVTVTRVSNNANLSNLTLSATTFSPGFSGATTDYTADVPFANYQTGVYPTPADSTATVRVNGALVPSGGGIPELNLNQGVTAISVVVTAQDGTTTQTYTVTVTRETAYHAWTTTNSLTGPNSGPLQDYDGNGLSNLIKFAFGLDPKNPGSNQLPVPVLDGNGNYGVTFWGVSLAAGVTYGAEWRADLSTGIWTPVADTGSGLQHIFSVPIGNNGSIFMRLKVSSP